MFRHFSTFEVTGQDTDGDKTEVDNTVHYTTFDSGAIEGGLQLLETLESNNTNNSNDNNSFM